MEISIKNLNIKDIDLIHQFLSYNYLIDNDQGITQIYSKDYIYWYLKNVPSELMIGLFYNNKIIGCCFGKNIQLIINNETKKYIQIRFLCISTKLKNIGYEKMLLDYYKLPLYIIDYYPFEGSQTIKNNIIPLNISKLKKIGFIDEELNNPKIKNKLSLLKDIDTDSTTRKIIDYYKKYDIKPYFNLEIIKNLLIPKKNIVYTFVIRNGLEVTDMISVHKYYYYCHESKETIITAYLNYYFCYTITLTELVTMLLDKLIQYEFDQFIYYVNDETSCINLTHFKTDTLINYRIDNRDAKASKDTHKIQFI